jgi:hypothetical protein
MNDMAEYGRLILWKCTIEKREVGHQMRSDHKGHNILGIRVHKVPAFQSPKERHLMPRSIKLTSLLCLFDELWPVQRPKMCQIIQLSVFLLLFPQLLLCRLSAQPP